MRNILDKIKKRKKEIYIATLLLLVIAGFIARKQKQPLVAPPQTPLDQEILVTPAPYQNLLSQTTANNQVYFLNRIKNPQTPVTDYSWHEKTLLYSTPQGIYEAYSNTILIEGNLPYIYFTNTGKAVFKNNTQWFTYDHTSKETQRLDMLLNQPALTNTGRYLVDHNNLELTVHDLVDTKTHTQKMASTVEKISLCNSSDKFAIETTEDIISVFDTGFNLKSQIIPENFSTLIDISPNGNLVALAQDNQLVIFNTSQLEAKQQAVVNFDTESEITGSWITDDELMIIETNANNPIKRINNIIWRVYAKGVVRFIADSKPITRKLVVDQKLKANTSSEILPLIENNGELWLLSLVPGVLPIYDDGQPWFSDVPFNRHAE